jgi:hypothetical protein
MDTEKRDGEKEQRVIPRVSKAQGGPAAQVDLSDSASRQDAEDLDYLRRIESTD